jgi:translocator protein
MSLILFLVLTVGGGLLIGFLNRPGAWYVDLAKPGFTPSNRVFAPIWTVLYVLIAIAGWRAVTRDPVGAPSILWSTALMLNFLWSPTFFRWHRLLASVFITLALLAAIVAFIALSWSSDSLSARLFVPYAAWAFFASILNVAIWRLNS